MDEAGRRGTKVWLGTVALCIAGAVALVCGIGAWMVESCCGTSDPGGGGYVLLGAGAAGCLWVGAAVVFSRSAQPPQNRQR